MSSSSELSWSASVNVGIGRLFCALLGTAFGVVCGEGVGEKDATSILCVCSLCPVCSNSATTGRSGLSSRGDLSSVGPRERTLGAAASHAIHADGGWRYTKKDSERATMENATSMSRRQGCEEKRAGDPWCIRCAWDVPHAPCHCGASFSPKPQDKHSIWRAWHVGPAVERLNPTLIPMTRSRCP